MRLRLFTTSLLFFIGLSVLMSESNAQTLPDFSSVNVSSLSDQQIENYLKQARAMGYSEQDLLSLAKSQGLSASDLSLLNERISSIKTLRLGQSQGSPIESTRMRGAYTDSLEVVSKISTDIYALDIFRKAHFYLSKPIRIFPHQRIMF